MSESIEPQNLTPEDLRKSGELDGFERYLRGEFDRARDQETEALNQLDKSLWIANGGAATVTISNLVASNQSVWLFLGASAFVVGLVFLLSMRMSYAFNASRDRARRQKASELLFKENRKISSLNEVRDYWFSFHRKLYARLNALAAVIFLSGCVLSLVGVFPDLASNETHNNSLKSGAPEIGALSSAPCVRVPQEKQNPWGQVSYFPLKISNEEIEA